MPINFHDKANATTYASRTADESWLDQMGKVLAGSLPDQVADIGCGGGIYSRGWKALGAKSVVGIDFSQQMIDDARASTIDPDINFHVGSAYETGLAADTYDIVFSRAVIHHLNDLVNAMREAFRIARPGGMVIVQDRTIEDVFQPASPTHFRAHFFTEFPRLLEEEEQRRPGTVAFANVLREVGFEKVTSESFWESRRIYADEESLRVDLRSRTGRSILHDLTDEELTRLTDVIVDAIDGRYPLKEEDRWTMWIGRKPKG